MVVLVRLVRSLTPHPNSLCDSPLQYPHARSHYKSSMLVREFAQVQYYLHHHQDGTVRKDAAHVSFYATDSCGSILGCMRLAGTPAAGEYSKVSARRYRGGAVAVVSWSLW